MKVFLFITLFFIYNAFLTPTTYDTYRNENKFSIDGLCAIHSQKYGYQGNSQVETIDHYIVNENGCKNGEICSETIDGYQCLKKPLKISKGEKCSIDSECYSNYCNKGFCSYYTSTVDDSHIDSCETGKFARAGNCVYYGNLNSGCENIGECQPLYECNKDKKCAQKGSLNKGTVLLQLKDDPITQVSIGDDSTSYYIFSADLCTSSYAIREGTNDANIKCVDVSNVSDCDQNLQCTADVSGLSGDGTTHITMSCGINNKANFCPILPERKNALQNYIDKIKKINYDDKRKDESAFYSLGLGDKELAEAEIIYKNYANLVSQKIIDPKSLKVTKNQQCIISFLAETHYSKSNYLIISSISLFLMILLL